MRAGWFFAGCANTPSGGACHPSKGGECKAADFPAGEQSACPLPGESRREGRLRLHPHCVQPPLQIFHAADEQPITINRRTRYIRYVSPAVFEGFSQTP